jgi:signal transduction histidine kinase
MMLDLQRLESVMGEPGRNFLNNLHGRLDHMGQSLHRVAWQLRPLSIDDLGLERALADFSLVWGERFGIAVDLQCVHCDFNRLCGDLTTSLYRICQEALTNVAKHAAGTYAAIDD